jgi:hypothetical protein
VVDAVYHDFVEILVDRAEGANAGEGPIAANWGMELELFPINDQSIFMFEF